MVEQVIAACYNKMRLANDVTKYRRFVLQGLIYNNNNNNNNNNNKTKAQAFICRDTTNVEHEIYVYP